nr:MerR family transcriptional regulator [Sporomusa silvacetica]
MGKLAKNFKLSRSTLLYYNSIGLLVSSGRTTANYRTYSEADCQRLEQICIYREAGLPLNKIKELLAGAKPVTASLLETRVYELNMEIAKLQEQQKSIIRLLLDYRAQECSGPVNWSGWSELFNAAGFDDYDKGRWHRDFEIMSPGTHQLFLESLELPTDRINNIRVWARTLN